MPKVVVRVFLLIASVAFLALPFINSPVLNDLTFRICLLIMVAISWNLMANAGLISLGHSAFWGVGCYATMFAANLFALPLIIGLLFALVAGALIGLIFTLLTARLRGFFFAICTLGLSEGLRVTSLMLPDLTGGAVGMFLNQPIPRLEVFVLAAVGAFLCIVFSAFLTQTRFHFACRGMRNHEGAAQMLGVDPRPYRLAVVGLSAAMTSYAGGLSAIYGAYIDPSIAFDLRVTVQSQIAPIIGGMYTVAGPIIGAFVIVVLADQTRVLFGSSEGISQLIFGIILVLAILFMPKGVVGLWERWTSRRVAGSNTPIQHPLVHPKVTTAERTP